MHHQLALSDHGGEPPVAAPDPRLPHHQPPAFVMRRASGFRHIAHRDRGQKIGLALNRRRRCALGQIENGRHRTDGVGQRHDRPAVQNVRDGAKLFAHGKPRHHAIRFG